MNQGDRYRRRNRLDRRTEGRFRHWIPVALFAALLALLLWLPFRDQQGDSVSSGNVSNPMAEQVAKEHAATSEGAGGAGVSKTAAHSDSSQGAMPGFGEGASEGARASEGVLDADPGPVVINSSIEGTPMGPMRVQQPARSGRLLVPRRCLGKCWGLRFPRGTSPQ